MNQPVIVVLRTQNQAGVPTSVSTQHEALPVRTDGVFSRVSWGCRLHGWGEHRRNRSVQFTEDFLRDNLFALFILGTSIYSKLVI